MTLTATPTTERTSMSRRDELAEKQTKYAPTLDSPFMAAVPGHGEFRGEYVNVQEVVRDAAIAAAMRGYDETPEFTYADGIFHRHLETLRASGAIELDAHDILSEAFRQAGENAAEFVARGWLRDRGSWPVEL